MVNTKIKTVSISNVWWADSRFESAVVRMQARQQRPHLLLPLRPLAPLLHPPAPPLHPPAPHQQEVYLRPRALRLRLSPALAALAALAAGVALAVPMALALVALVAQPALAALLLVVAAALLLVAVAALAEAVAALVKVALGLPVAMLVPAAAVEAVALAVVAPAVVVELVLAAMATTPVETVGLVSAVLEVQVHLEAMGARAGLSHPRVDTTAAIKTAEKSLQASYYRCRLFPTVQVDLDCNSLTATEADEHLVLH